MTDFEFDCFLQKDDGPQAVISYVFLVIITIFIECGTRFSIELNHTSPDSHHEQIDNDPRGDSGTSTGTGTGTGTGTIPISTTTQMTTPVSKPRAWDRKYEALHTWITREILPLSKIEAGPRARTYRFIGATCLLCIMIVILGFRINDVISCDGSWWLFSIFGILPFASAATAWLRSGVDVVLWRWERSVTKLYWPPLLPIFGVVFVGIWVVVWVSVFVMDLIGVSRGVEGDIELGIRGAGMERDEEELGLLGSCERYDDHENHDDELTVYSLGAESVDDELDEDNKTAHL